MGRGESDGRPRADVQADGIRTPASSGVVKQTKPKPLHYSLSSFMAMHDATVPKGSKSSRSEASVVPSSKFLM